jgi:hypothetical protein
MSAPPSLRLAAALARLGGAQASQQAELIRLRLALHEARAAVDGLGKSADAHRDTLGRLRADVDRLGATCRRLEEIIARVGGNGA